MKDSNPEIQRLREEYARRSTIADGDNRYSASNPAYQWMLKKRRLAIVELLQPIQESDFSKLRILEMGCGGGGVLQELVELGADPENLFGIDLLYYRLRIATNKLPACSFITANGQHIPFPCESFDLILQFTAFSSILDPSTKSAMAFEMKRVLKPGSAILWYDFVWNPLNRQTRGIPLSEVRKLFPEMPITSRRITLAPPITRALLPRYQSLADKLTRLSFLNSHLIIWIQKPW